ncbi:alpha/beta-hydrolase [Rhizodiscina lignyota]|uniref:Alpha/beta-hydrolase n=1 Tax=Rhizodiscina lignyota TaxID=1504668 RepID=A0A9P4IJ14_9PEZI|nr:alpha/beta-hydrolase [Rhizodiscina lignyota]
MISHPPSVFYVGGEYIRDGKGTHMSGQMCIRHYTKGIHHCPAIIFIHGAAQTRSHFEATPDGQPGLALLQVQEGRDCYVVDLPGIGRSRYHHVDMGPLTHYTAEELQATFTAPNLDSWPTAKLHTQWPGTGKMRDANFDAFYASQVGHIADYKIMEQLVRKAFRALLLKTGPAYLVTHSQSGPLGWHIADECPDSIKGIVALEPHGPPFEYPDFPPFDKRPQIVGILAHPFGITSTPLQYSPPLEINATQLSYERYYNPKPQEAGLASGCRQKSPARHLVNLASIPVVVVTAEASYDTTFDHLTVEFLRDAGVSVEHVYLVDKGIHGNGHLMAIESNNQEIQRFINRCLVQMESVRKGP